MDKINGCNFSDDVKEILESLSALGDRLRQARESMGLTQQSVAKSLCLKLSVINGIEEGYLDRLEISLIFLYGYIRSYARLVGIDSEKIVIPVLCGLHPLLSVQDGNRFRIFHLWNSYKDKVKLLIFFSFIFLVSIIVILLLGMYFSKYFSNKKEYTNVLSLNPISFVFKYSKNNDIFFSKERILNRNFDIFNDIYYSVNDIRYSFCSILCCSKIFDKLLNDMKYYGLYDDVFCCFSNNIITMYSIDDNIRDLNHDMLVMSFISNCWVEVFDSFGKRLYVGTQYAGNVLNLRGEIPYKLIIGAPQSVEIKYRGNIVSLDRFINPYKVARITIPD